MSLPLMFALAFPVEAPPGENVFAIEIPAAAYATLTQPDLRDLAVIDGNGTLQTISLVRPAPVRAEPPTPIALPNPIAIPAGVPRRNERLDLHIARDVEGRLTRLDLGSGVPPADSGGREWLVDAGPAAQGGYSGLRVRLAEGSGDFRTLVTLSGSDDLAQWTRLASGVPLLRVSDAGQRIERLELRFPPAHFRYLALETAPDAPPLPPLASVSALRESDGARVAERETWLEGRPDTDAEGGAGLKFQYPSPGLLPVTGIGVRLAERNAIRAFTLSQRSGDAGQRVLAGTAWRFEVGGVDRHSPAQEHALPGVGALRIELRQPAAAPTLVLRYAPAQVVVVASGPPPFRLLAGSGAHRAEFVPMDEALGGLRAVRGVDWTPPLATVGIASTLGGETALRPVRTADPGRIALWAVLGLGALLVAGLAFRLLKGTPTLAG